jgi:hypothetical protein
LGEQAKIKGVAGVWAELTDSVNQMAGNLTAQVTKCSGGNNRRGKRRSYHVKLQ